jgi:RND family efflux transporter MFP subunit
MKRLRPAPLVLALVAAAGCSNATDERAAQAGRPPVAVETARVATSDIEQAVEVVGALSARSEADVKSEYSGTVAEVYVTQWVRVQKGTPLARLDTREAAAAVQLARAVLLQAEVAVQRAGRELERTAKLQESGVATPQALDEARTVDEAARAQSAAARAQLEMAETRLDKAVLRSPIEGVVARRTVNVGDYVENMGSPAPMFHIVDARALELVASVPSARIAELKVGQPVVFSCDALPGRELGGRVSFVNPAAEEVSRTVKVKVEVPNVAEALKPGLFVKGRIVTGTRAGVVVLPRSALVTWDAVHGTGAVFLLEGGLARRRGIQTGALAGESVEVVGGLQAGDEVVTRGGFNLRDGERVRTVQGS